MCHRGNPWQMQPKYGLQAGENVCCVIITPIYKKYFKKYHADY
jgi:hypothetical protein